mgnify:CR=1 FL=1
MTDPKVILDRMELLGEETIREQIASGALNEEQKRDARIWLGMKAMERKAGEELVVRATLDQAKEARSANRLAFAALVLSIIATAVSVAAYVYR